MLMTGGLMQLVAYGAQDIYLTGNPMITYFKVVYRRHTNFAMESIRQTFNGSVSFGSKVSALISRNGDLVSGVMLEATLPTSITSAADDYARWTDDVGHHLIKEVSVSIGGQQIDKHYGDWLEIWAQLTVPASQEAGYRQMIGQDPVDVLGRPTGLQEVSVNTAVTGRKLYVPLQFWFCRNVGLALPLIALQYHEVKIDIEFESQANLVVNRSNNNGPDTANNGALTTVGSFAAELWVDYIYLDTDERRRFAQVSHEYLIEQLQFTGDESLSTNATANVDLNFNHPVKELVWVVRHNVNLTGDGTGGRANQYSNYTNKQAALAPRDIDLGNLTSLNDNAVTSLNAQSGMSMKAPIGSVNPIATAKLQLNGHDRFAAREGRYFNQVQTSAHHTNVPASPGINVYSFALKPEDHQPSGTCNFSRIDNAKLVLTLAAGVVGEVANNTSGGADTCVGTSRTIKVYAVNYNVLRIMSGMGGLAYSN